MFDEVDGDLPPQLEAIERDTRAIGFDMASDRRTGALLRVLSASRKGACVLELGTGTGLATSWMLDGMDERSRLLTVDNDETTLAVARRHLGADSRLTIRCADANATIGELAAERFDLIFADTWGGKYESLEPTLALLAPGGLYVIDDMLPQPNWPQGHAPKVEKLIAALTRDTRLRTVRLGWSSGLILATRR